VAARSQTNRNVFSARVNRSVDKSAERSMLVLAYGWWCCMAGKVTVGLVGSNGCLLPGKWFITHAWADCLEIPVISEPYTRFTSMKVPYVEEMRDIMSIYTRNKMLNQLVWRCSRVLTWRLKRVVPNHHGLASVSRVLLNALYRRHTSLPSTDADVKMYESIYRTTTQLTLM